MLDVSLFCDGNRGQALTQVGHQRRFLERTDTGADLQDQLSVSVSEGENVRESHLDLGSNGKESRVELIPGLGSRWCVWEEKAAVQGGH